MKKNIIVFLITACFLIIFLSTKVVANGFAGSDSYYLLHGGFIQLELQTYQVFPNQTFLAMVTVKTSQSYDANAFNVIIELPSSFVLVDDVFSHPNQPINETTNYEWSTSWLVNSSDTPAGIYKINVTEDLFDQNDSDTITVNPGPTEPYDITVTTDKSSYSSGESGVVFGFIFDDNDYPFNLDGICNSSIYYPDGNPTSFLDVPLVYISGSLGEYVSSQGFQAWNNAGTYTVEVNCTNPEDGYASNTFGISVVTTTPSATTSPPGPGPGPRPTTSPPKVSNFTIYKDLIRVELKPGETDKESIIISNTGDTELTIDGEIQYLDEFSFFTGDGTTYTFELDQDETRELEINFIVKRDQEPGVYPGKIVFTSGSLERTVLVVVEIESQKPLFDVKVEVLPEYRIVYPGDRVMAQLTLYNLGEVGRVDAGIEYGIKGLDGTIITSEYELVAVETQLSTIKSLDLPADLKPDSYVFYSKVTYDGISGTGSSMFSVTEMFKLNLFLLGLLILIIIVVLMILFIYFFRKRKKKKKRKSRRKTKKKPKKPVESQSLTLESIEWE